MKLRVRGIQTPGPGSKAARENDIGEGANHPEYDRGQLADVGIQEVSAVFPTLQPEPVEALVFKVEVVDHKSAEAQQRHDYACGPVEEELENEETDIVQGKPECSIEREAAYPFFNSLLFQLSTPLDQVGLDVWRLQALASHDDRPASLLVAENKTGINPAVRHNYCTGAGAPAPLPGEPTGRTPITAV